MSNYDRRMLTPGVSRKRKEMEDFDAIKPLLPSTVVTTSISTSKEKEDPASSSNWLLAGYLAYEFLTKGSILGEKWDPAQAEAVTVSPADGPREGNPCSNSRGETGKTPREAGEEKLKQHSYADVARLLKIDGSHIAQIFNPSQLARWPQM